ncbi:MAG: tRNA guanosine(34) transglycosylase Tgt [Chloroflexi bacterium HGW-Chloroflexi-10]|nr:MAG: tRNA guanosine(34) transglycosylase Tgt [Chloroflexi bacterium HGW-Chloroflexi-10]
MLDHYPNSLTLPHGKLTFPVYLPDATYGLVRAVDSIDLENAGIQAVVMNAFHLMQKPGSSTIQSLGGLHAMSGWQRPIITDSGGFQAYSLIRQNAKFGSMSSKGINFQPEGSDRKFQLTPEKSVQLQLAYGADVVICLDDCTHVDASLEEQERSVERTISWAKRCRESFDLLVKQKKLPPEQQPLLFGVIQGGGIKELRKKCADALLKIGFDGYGYGGWPLDGEGNLLTDILAYSRSLIPPQYPMHALGIGHPYNVLACYDLGYGIFDCAMPTRDARHGRLYTFTQTVSEPNAGLTDKWLKYLYINDEDHIKADSPISHGCDCLTCIRYSRGYLHHLFKMNDGLYHRLATIHNLRFMTQLTERIQQRGL